LLDVERWGSIQFQKCLQGKDGRDTQHNIYANGYTIFVIFLLQCALGYEVSWHLPSADTENCAKYLDTTEILQEF
jgi:hypothetical protein